MRVHAGLFCWLHTRQAARLRPLTYPLCGRCRVLLVLYCMVVLVLYYMVVLVMCQMVVLVM